ncbi:hypothetical protein H2198_005656 [Neophaeococcomyces mojaviensis]|uniref:Uncharacterized protein n=1 Tax=Neophaeococcomyces mojaviensis TaxID=3383035 RepID=A0ACC3A5E4_9EURO|nr:hypothetical protein H2198_005656 [Knufia sp. JES_112]
MAEQPEKQMQLNLNVRHAKTECKQEPLDVSDEDKLRSLERADLALAQARCINISLIPRLCSVEDNNHLTPIVGSKSLTAQQKKDKKPFEDNKVHIDNSWGVNPYLVPESKSSSEKDEFQPPDVIGWQPANSSSSKARDEAPASQADPAHVSMLSLPPSRPVPISLSSGQTRTASSEPAATSLNFQAPRRLRGAHLPDSDFLTRKGLTEEELLHIRVYRARQLQAYIERTQPHYPPRNALSPEYHDESLRGRTYIIQSLPSDHASAS